MALIEGGSGDDTLIGTVGDDTINGNGGNDNIRSGPGNDMIFGGPGNDLIEPQQGSDTIVDTEGNNFFLLIDPHLNSLTGGGSLGLELRTSTVGAYFNAVDNVPLISGARFVLRENNGGSNVNNILGVATIEFVFGSEFDDVFIFGSYLRDLSYFNSGSGRLPESGGTAVDGRGGNDYILGGRGRDTINGGAGNDTINGNSGDDRIDGSTGDDNINGSGGDDVIFGDVGNDTLYGGDGVTGPGDNDIVYGGAGDDYLNGSFGDDQLYGEDGNDTIDDGISPGPTGGNNLLDGGAGNDRLILHSLRYTVNGGADYDTLEIDLTELNANDVLIDFRGYIAGTSFVSGQGTLNNIEAIVRIIGSPVARNIIYLSDGTGATRIDGAGNDDLLVGNSFDNIINGGNGQDTIIGGGGRDQLSGGGGDDRLILASQIAGAGPFNGGSGTDTLVVTFLSGGPPSAGLPSSTTQFYGNSGNADFASLISIERLEFQAVAGNVLNANFIFQQFAGSGITELVGSSGVDILNIIALNGGTYTIPTLTRTNWTQFFSFRESNDAVYLVAFNQPGQNFSYTLNASVGHAGIEVLFGASGNDVLNGTDGVEGLNGKGGIDQLHAGGGDDLLGLQNIFINALVSGTVVAGASSTLTGAGSLFDGGAGFDVLLLGGAINFQGTLQSIEGIFLQAAFNSNVAGGEGQVVADITIAGQLLATLPSTLQLDGTGTFTVNLAAGDIFNGAGYTFFQGSNVQLIINAAPGNNNITGTSRSDDIRAGAGNDVLNGSAGNDLIEGGAGDDVLIGGAGIDTISYASSSFGVTVHLDNATAQNTVQQGIDTISGFENILGSASHDSLFGDDFDNVINAGAGFDTITSGGGTNTLIGGADGDLYFVQGVNDIVVEAVGGGYDIVLSQVNFSLAAGSEVEALAVNTSAGISLTGNEFQQFLTGNVGSDTLDGGGGNDLIISGLGTNTLIGGTGDDIYYSEGLNDVITEAAGGGFDVVLASGNLTLAAGSEVEFIAVNTANGVTIIGSNSNQTIQGAGGNDRLIGGLGNDRLQGSGGADTFVLGNTFADRDFIVDFASGSDRLEISAALFGGGLAAGVLSASQFLSGAGVTAATTAGQRFIYNSSNGNLLFDADGNGAGAAVLFASILNVPALTAADFLIAG